MSSNSAKKFAFGAVIAAVAGYVTGILTAPKSGKETRQEIKSATERGMAEAEKQLKKLHTQMNDLIAQGIEKAKELRGTAQKDLNLAIDKASAAKEKARDLLSALHEGGADDKDLKKAISEANQAIEHLKTYLSKQS